MCERFQDNELSIHIGEDKTKSVLFAPKHKMLKFSKPNMTYKNIQIKQSHT